MKRKDLKLKQRKQPMCCRRLRGLYELLFFCMYERI